MNNDHDHVSNIGLEKLLLRAIDQGNSAARSEIQRRKIAAKLSLWDYIFREQLKIRGLSVAPTEEQIDDLDKTIDRPSTTVDLEGIDLSDDPDMICVLARRMRRDGYYGQLMKDQARAKTYIAMAADNPRVLDELPDSGKAFWKSAEFHFRMWKTEQANAR